MKLTISQARPALEQLARLLLAPLASVNSNGFAINYTKGAGYTITQGDQLFTPHNFNASELNKALTTAARTVEYYKTHTLPNQLISAKNAGYREGYNAGAEAARVAQQNAQKVCSFSNMETAVYIDHAQNDPSGRQERDAIATLYAFRAAGQDNEAATNHLANLWKSADLDDLKATNESEHAPSRLHSYLLSTALDRVNYFELARYFVSRVDDADIEEYAAEQTATLTT